MQMKTKVFLPTAGLATLMAALGASNQLSLFPFNPSTGMQEDISHQERGDPACPGIAFYFVQSMQEELSGQASSPQPAWNMQSLAPAPAQQGEGVLLPKPQRVLSLFQENHPQQGVCPGCLPRAVPAVPSWGGEEREELSGASTARGLCGAGELLSLQQRALSY